MKKCALIYNPESGRQLDKNAILSLPNLLVSKGYYTLMCPTRKAKDAIDIIKDKIVSFLVKQIYKMKNSIGSYGSLIIRSCLIRGGLVLADSSSLNDITKFYNALKNGENKESYRILQMCFYKMIEDREKQISLKL